LNTKGRKEFYLSNPKNNTNTNIFPVMIKELCEQRRRNSEVEGKLFIDSYGGAIKIPISASSTASSHINGQESHHVTISLPARSKYFPGFYGMEGAVEIHDASQADPMEALVIALPGTNAIHQSTRWFLEMIGLYV
jgi:hypothetical protein